MKQEENKTQDDSDKSSVEEVNNDSQTETAEENIDDEIRDAIGEHNIPASDNTEEKTNDKEDTTDPNEKEETVLEKPTENAGNDIEQGESLESQREKPEASEPGRLEKRIAKIYINNQLLQGEEDVPDLNEVARMISGNSIKEKKEALHRLLAQNKVLRRGERDDEGNLDDAETTELSPEDHEALIEAEAEQRLQEMQSDIDERDFQDDLVKTVESHPELDENSKEYNQKIGDAVEKLVLKGMKCSDAYDLVTDSINKITKEEEDNQEIDKQEALSGSIGSSNTQVKSENLTWEKMEKIRESDPALFEKMVNEGNVPQD